MAVKSKLVTVGDTANVVVVLEDGTVLVADHNHARFDDIKLRVMSQDWDDIEKLFSVGKGIVTAFEKIGTRVTIRDDKLFFEGEKLDDSLADLIVRLYNEDADYEPFVRFLEKLKNNPNGHSVENLFRWLRNGSFALDWQGNILAYKGLSNDFTSRTSGSAIHNGQPFNGYIPNNVGDVIEMDRGQVQHNPSVGCSVGLHAGTWNYASTFGPIVVLIQIDPRDVVSVPTDCNDEKMRVCRYKVVAVVEDELESAYYGVKVPQVELDNDRFSDDSLPFDADADDDDIDVELAKLKFNVGDRVVVHGEPGVVDEVDCDDTLWVDFDDGDSDGWYDFADVEREPASDPVDAEPGEFHMDDYVKVLASALANDSVPSNLIGKVGRVAAVIDYALESGSLVKVKFDGGERTWVSNENLAPAQAPTKVDTTKNYLNLKRGPDGRFLPKGS